VIKNKVDSKYTYLAAKLKIDCEKCSGLCCVALYCMKTDGFPADKEAGKPCKYLMSDFCCAIHSKLASNNMRGCLAYDCFGAGQKTTQIYYPNGTWETNPEQASEIFGIFLTVFQLHQMLWYLVEAFSLTSDEHLKSAIDALIFQNEQMTRQSPDDISQLNIEKYRLKVNEVLKRVTSTISVDASDKIRSTDYFGRDFKKANLDGRDFSMSLMIAANLEGCSLQRTNFLGADMRDANLKNTDLSECMFLTQMQINSAKGNLNTKIPINLSRPIAWQGL
jgi:hypothetical protein